LNPSPNAPPHRTKPAVYVRIALIAAAGVLVLIALFGLTGLKEREIFSSSLPDGLDSFLQTDTPGLQRTEEKSSLEPAALQGRYEAALSRLKNIRNSPEAERMGESGQQRVVDHVSTSVMLAQQSFAEGDAGHALHLLETAYAGWQAAIGNLARIPVVENPGNRPAKEPDQAGPGGQELAIENPLQPDTGQKTAGLSGTVGSAPSTQDNQTVHDRAFSSSRFAQSLAELDGLLAAWRMDHPDRTDYHRVFGDVLERREQSLEAHRENDLTEAMRRIGLALNETALILEKEEEAFQLSMDVARQAYRSGDVAKAESAISSAEILRPDLEEVRYWKERIRQLPLWLQAQHDAKNARNAGHLQNEKDALMRMLALVPGDAAAARRVDEITLQMDDRRLRRLIGRGYRALENGHAAQARSAWSEARKLGRSSTELPKLHQAIVDLEQRQAIARHLETARHESAQDNWIQALNHYRKVLAMDSAHPEASQGRDFATAILAAQQELDDFLAQPDRLSSPDIATAARAAVETARVLGTFSPRLHAATDTLEASVVKWQTPVPVRVLSDNETDIRIRGVGKVGKTTERIIEILPGKYLFEGKRNHYRSVLVEVHVEADPTALTEVTVICHESS